MTDLPPQSAGLLVNSDVPTAKPNDTVFVVLEYVKAQSANFDSVDYVYIINEVRNLVGVVSLHELLSAEPQSQMNSIMATDLAYAHIRTDQEHVAQMALAQSVKAIPVVSDDNSFIGAISADTILRILSEEHTEDIYKAAGLQLSREGLTFDGSIAASVKSRIPWLLIGLLGGLFAAVVIEQFESTISKHLALAAFIPAVVYIADAVGTQSQMLFVRLLGQNQSVSVWAALRREWGVGTIVGLIIGLAIFTLSFVWLADALISLILALAIVATVYFSVTVAVVLPWLFKKIDFDPAVASGPLATVIRDISSLLIYLLIAGSIL